MDMVRIRMSLRVRRSTRTFAQTKRPKDTTVAAQTAPDLLIDVASPASILIVCLAIKTTATSPSYAVC